MSDNEYLEKTKFVSALGLSLHQCGATSHRIEQHLTNVCELLGIHGTFFHTPTSFTFCFWRDDPSQQHIQMERIHSNDENLGRLELLDSLIERFAADELDFEEMKSEFQQVLSMPNYYRKWQECLAWVVLSGCFAALLSDNANDPIVACVVTALIFAIAQASVRFPRLQNTLEISTALFSGIVVTGIAAIGVKINVPFVILSTIIVFVPGLSLTVALSEIAQRDLVSGTSKFVHSVMALFKLYFGAILGVGIGALLWGSGAGDTVHDIQTLPSWKTLPIIFGLATFLLVAFNIHIKQLFWCALSSLIGHYVAHTSEAYFGVAAGMFLGAFAVGAYSNIYSHIRNAPASMVLSHGLILLVPGSKTYIILNSWITGEQMLESSSNGNQAFLIFISLVAGLLFANALVATRKSL